MFANQYAPEHLEAHTSDPRSLLPDLKNYGTLFLGEDTAEVYADKVAGLNHPLPTGGTVRRIKNVLLCEPANPLFFKMKRSGGKYAELH